jgi:hypothetical protein
MNPQDSSASRLASVSNAITNGNAPQYTPPGTPVTSIAPTKPPAAVYTPPVLQSGQYVAPPIQEPRPPAVPTPQPTSLPITNSPSLQTMINQTLTTQPTQDDRNRQRTGTIVALAAGSLLLVLGLLYWYGASTLGVPVDGGIPVSGAVPENGFQVTDSTVFEPNFDSTQPTATDPVRVFDDSALPLQ